VKRLFIAILATLLFAAALAAAIAYDPGYVLIAFGNYTMETTVWVGIALLLVILLAMYLLILIIHRGVRQGSFFSRWRSNWRDRRGRQLTQRGLLAYLEGNFERARVVLDRAAARAETPALNYVLAARAAAAQGEHQIAEQYLLRAQRSEDHTEFAIALTRAELNLRQGKLQEALVVLTRIRNHAAKHPYILQLLRDTYTALRDWPNLLQLLPQLRKHKVMSKDATAELEVRITINLLEELAVKQQIDALRQVWRDAPRTVTQDARAVASYARALLALDQATEAEPLLRNQLKRERNAELIELYGRIGSAEPARQLAQVEQWLREFGGSAALYLCAGRIAVRNELWGKAREYFEQSLKVEERPEVYAELGSLLARLGQFERSSDYFARGLLGVVQPELSQTALPRTA
jgi:HemY protein